MTKILIEEATVKLALEALEGVVKNCWRDIPSWRLDEIKERITAIKQAQTQTVQEQPSEAIVQTFTGLPMRKLRDLLTAGYRVNGVSFERTQEDGTVQRGAATTGGMVLWWNQTPAQKRPQNCGTGYCSCIECVMEPAPVQEPKQSPPFTFRRFVAGSERAQDVAVHREITLEAAIRVAAKICPPSESGHPTVLVYTQPAAQPAVPDAITDSGENPEYRAGWNECRETMLEMMKARTL
jgi:hypothetical protein